MSGHAMPWNKEPSGQEKEDMREARTLQKEQKELLARQKREAEERTKKLNLQQIGMLRSRFGVGGGVSTPSTTAGAAGALPLQGMSDTAGSLYSRITGR